MPTQQEPISLAIIAPFYNEEANVQPFYGQVCAALEGLGVD